MARSRRVRGSSRPRPLEHARDDRRRRDADRNRALLVRRCRGSSAVRSPARGSPRAPSGSPPSACSSSTSRSSATGSRSGGSSRDGCGLPGRQGAHGRLVPRPDRDGRGRDGHRLLVLRGHRLPHRSSRRRLVRVPKPSGHLWKFIATGAAGLTVGTVQGVIQVQPANADWLYRAGHAGEWIDPIAHAHINLVTGLTMLVAGALFYARAAARGKAPSRRAADTLLLPRCSSDRLRSTRSTLYLGFHEGRLVHGGLTPEQAEEATRSPSIPPHGRGHQRCSLGFWLLLAARHRLLPWQHRRPCAGSCSRAARRSLSARFRARCRRFRP